jgi:hypothetical protein
MFLSSPYLFQHKFVWLIFSLCVTSHSFYWISLTIRNTQNYNFICFFMSVYGCETWSPKPPSPREQTKMDNVEAYSVNSTSWPKHKRQEWEEYIIRSFVICIFHQIRLWAIKPYLLTWGIWWATINVSRWQMKFHSAFKGLNPDNKMDGQDVEYARNRCEMQLWRNGTVWEM